MKVDFYWDIGSTNTYFGLHLIRPIQVSHPDIIEPVSFGPKYDDAFPLDLAWTVRAGDDLFFETVI